MPLRRMLLFPVCFFVFIFCFGLLCGGDRLFSMEEPGSPVCAIPSEAYPPLLPAAFLGMSGAQRDPDVPFKEMSASNAGQARDRARLVALESHSAEASPERDANGNVLQEESYMQAVYHAFALGDGDG